MYSKLQRQEVLGFAQNNGLSHASRKYNVSLTTIRTWIDPQYKSAQLKGVRQIMKKNPSYRLYIRALARIHSAYITRRLKCPLNAADLLGCTQQEFFNHITSQLTHEYTLENYGKKWHIDHVIPIRSFDITDLNEALKCFNYKNTRPLDIKENLSKKYLCKRCNMEITNVV